ncbi:kinase-like domain-containing protein [Spinellus fusiger]|nr:kinase-like domain-containing protein [Spinellus fusiger]
MIVILAADYNELLKELSSQKMTSVGCYSIGYTIGTGTYGKVKLGTHKLTGQQVAIKKIDKKHAPLMAREIHHHRQLRHPNIVTLYEVIATESTIHLVSEYCPNGELFDVLTENGRFSEARAQKWFRQIVQAVQMCHQQGIIHRDLKLENILLDADNNAKLCDFGFARYAESKQLLETFCGSLAYSAPEVIQCQKHIGSATDIWSLGVILFTLLAGELPFDDDCEAITQKMIVNVDYKMPSYFSLEAADLIQHLLQLNALDRLSIHQVANHPWLNRTIEEDEGDDSSLSTHNSSHTDVDSIFSVNQKLNVLEEDDEEEGHEEEREQDTTMMMKNTLHRDSYASAKINTVSSAYSLSNIHRPEDRHRSHSILRNGSTNSYAFANPTPSSMRGSMLRESNKLAEETPMSAIEHKLATSLYAAGFDMSVVKNMRSGSCDTLGTLWRMLLQQIDHETEKNQAVQPVKQPPAYTAMNMDSTLLPPTKKAVEADEKDHLSISSTYSVVSCLTSSYSPSSASISTQKTGWLGSVRSWFGMALYDESSNEKIGYRAFDTLSRPTSEQSILSPTYGGNNQKQRCRTLQLSDPPVNQLDQLTFSATSPVLSPGSHPLHQARRLEQETTSDCIDTNLNTTPTAAVKITSIAAATAPIYPRTTTDPLSIITTDIHFSGSAGARVIEMDHERYRSRSHSLISSKLEFSPPPSPPNVSTFEMETNHSEPCLSFVHPYSPEEAFISPPRSPQDYSSVFSHVSTVHRPLSIGIPKKVIPCAQEEFTSTNKRFDFTPRTRLSTYNMGEDSMRTRMSSKMIIEEEEEEE